jgi:hypothetical protein
LLSNLDSLLQYSQHVYFERQLFDRNPLGHQRLDFGFPLIPDLFASDCIRVLMATESISQRRVDSGPLMAHSVIIDDESLNMRRETHHDFSVVFPEPRLCRRGTFFHSLGQYVKDYEPSDRVLLDNPLAQVV